jgi:DNA polymerase (family 10)
MSKGIKVSWIRAANVANRFLRTIGAHRFEEVMLAGSIRRQKEMVGDIDVVLVVRDLINREQLNEKLKKLWGTLKTPKLKHRAKRGGLFEDMQIQVLDVQFDQLGAALLHATGSWQFNVMMRSKAMSNGWKLNQYGLFDQVTGEEVCDASNERSIFDALGMGYVHPTHREISE